MDTKELLSMIAFVKGKTKDPKQQAEMLGMLLDEDPPESMEAVESMLPVQNEIPAFSLKQDNLGGELLGTDYGVPAPMFGQAGPKQESVGDLLVGEM